MIIGVSRVGNLERTSPRISISDLEDYSTGGSGFEDTSEYQVLIGQNAEEKDSSKERLVDDTQMGTLED